MKFTNHLFISYAHIDNERAEENDPGWVDRFDKALKAFLDHAIGDDAKIWRDHKLAGGDVFNEEIVSQIHKAALLVSIVSPRYLKSEWCLKEVEEFCKVAEIHGGLAIGNKMRVHGVMLMPLTADLREKLPGKLKQQLGYLFYKEKEGGRFERLDPRFGEEFQKAFNRKVNEMAYELAGIIEKLKEEENPIPEPLPAEPAGPPKPIIYLAECSWDRADDREKIRSELWATGYTVLPERGTFLPDNEMEYVAEVERLLDCCQLSIHAVGSNGGKVLDGPGRKEVVRLQNEIAAQKSQEGVLSRLIWLPALSSGQPEQQSFIGALRSKKELQRGGDLIEDNLEGFKDVLRITLKKLEELSSKKAEPTEAGGHTIYLLCVAAERPATIPLRKFLKGQGLEVQLPVFEGDAATVRQTNQDLLATCDAVLVFYGAGDEAWKRTTETDLQKIKSCRRGKPLLNIFTYLAPPLTGHKQDCIDMGEENLIMGFETFTEAAMQPLVEAMKGT
jgi:TIR domain